MSTILWRGDATAVAQVVTATPDNVEVGDIFTLTVNNKSVSYTAQAATVADVVAGLAAAWNNASAAELAEITATDDDTHLTLTADQPGVPFSVSGEAVDGGGADTQSLTLDTVVEASGPHHWSTPANWSGGVLPANGDDVCLEASETAIRYGLDQAAVTLNSLQVAASYTGEIGLPRRNTSGASGYVEYRPRYLQIGAAAVVIGHGEGDGSGRLLLDTGSVQTEIVVHRTAAPAEQQGHAFAWKGTHAGNALHVRAGHVGVAAAGGEDASLVLLSQSGGRVEIGPGATLTTVQRAGGGMLLTRSSVSTLNQFGGETQFAGEAAAGTIQLRGGLIDFRSGGNLTTLTVEGDDAVIDFSHDGRARTVTNCTLTRGQIVDPLRSVTFGNGIQPGGRLTGFDAA